MSTIICHAFVQNAWRKDICSNCFRVRDEHSEREIDSNSVKYNISETSGGINNGVNIPSIVPRNNNNKKHGNETNALLNGSSENIGTSQIFSQKTNRFQGTANSNVATTISSNNAILSSAFGQQGSSSSIPRINNGTPTVDNGFSGTNNNNNASSATTTTTSKGYTIHLGLSGSKSKINIGGGGYNNSNEFNNDSSTLSETNGKMWNAEGSHTKATTTLSSHLHSNQPQTFMQQGKGVMTSDNGSVIPNNNDNNNKHPMTSSAAAASVVSHLSSTTASPSTLLRSASSSYIASKNIFNNAHTNTTTTAAASAINHSNHTTADCMNGNISGSTGLSQSTNSIKRGNIASSLPKVSGGCSGTVVDIGVPCNNNGEGNTALRESPEGAVVSTNSFCTSVSKGVIVISPQNGMNRPRAVKPMEVKADSDNVFRRKVGLSGVNSSTTQNGSSGGQVMMSSGRTVGKPTAAPRMASKGILRNKNGHNRKRAKNVRFPDEVVSVIGYGGGPSGMSDDEDDAPPHPLDSASVNEVMEKNATTLEEKDLHKVTQKNTNFNSIKTNLLGTTCIEIGPIVGCTGGKSMEGSSKPLVSIGTFETRKEPLKIHKKISEDSADDELNDKTIEKHRKFTPRSSGTGGGGKPPLPKSQAPAKSSSIQSINNTSQSSGGGNTVIEFPKQQQTVLSSRSVLSSNNKTASSSSTTINSINSNCSSKTTVSSSKTSGSISTKNVATTPDKGNGSSSSSTTTIEVNPEKAYSPCATTTRNVIQSSKECITALSSSSTESSVKSKTSSSTTTTANRIVSSSTTDSSNTSGSTTAKANKWENKDNMTSSTTEGLSVRKPILKRTQQKTESCEGYTVNTAVAEMNKSSTSTISSHDITNTTSTLNGRNSNFVLFANGDKSKATVSSNHNSIASKRSSFLRDIIIDSSSTPAASSATIDATTAAAGDELKSNKGASAATASSGGGGGVQVICKNNNNSSSHEQDSLMIKSELKVDLKPSVNNGKLSHPPFGECLSNRSNGTDDSSEFDDSLEDSGLDIKKCSEISESDEKSGSGSDSGNENDFSDRDRNISNCLLISVESRLGTVEAEKLSPDSVLFSSEMSASGSSESIPEALDTVSNGSSQKSSSSSSSGNDSGAVGNGGGNTNVKRTAPRPPANAGAVEIPSNNSNELYANSQNSVDTVDDGIYDDVYKNPMHFPQNDGKMENIYDDCLAISAPNKGKAGGKSVVGSYNFHNSSHNDEDDDEVTMRRSDGIEFIGIRKIDSESFLRERSPTPDSNSKIRSSSVSPKPRRRVNQFFSTIGKKAGAAFSQHVQGYKNKSNPGIEDSGIEKSPSGSGSAYKRSLSTDEVSMTRTQEIYATLTPTRFKGLGPVLHKLSRIELNLGDRDKGTGDDVEGLDSKGYKKNKMSLNIKKFLRFGSKGSGESSGNKYDFGNCTKTETNGTSNMITTQISEEDQLSSRTPTPTKTVPLKLPPPIPPRNHSLDLNRGVPGGTVRPVRPPPPSRNRVAPKPTFTEVFNNPNADKGGNKVSEASNDSEASSTSQIPNKPSRRKGSMTNGISRDLETTYNHITTLNLETLKLIASQTPMKIKQSSNERRRRSNSLKWFHFEIASCPLSQGHGFVFYSAVLENESCVLLVQERLTAPNFTAPFEFPCVETLVTFEDCIPDTFVTWRASEYNTSGTTVKVFVSVMPKFNMYSVEKYMRHSQVPLLHKYFALLQAMAFWDKEEMSNLLVLVQSMEESENHFMANPSPRNSSSDMPYQPSSPSSVLVYVHPVPHLSTSSGQIKVGGGRSSSSTQLCPDFENAMKQLLLNNGSNDTTSLLGNNDRQVLMKRLCDKKGKAVQDQFRLFLQVKLFAPKRDSEELERIKTLRSERAIQQWLDRERAMCMKEAVEQTLQRNVESSISPYKRSYLEFLLTPENSAKAVLDMLIDLLE